MDHDGVSEIQNLVARLAQLADDGDLADYLDLYTEDAVWEFPGNPALGIPANSRHGRDDIGASATQRRAEGRQGPGSATRHVVQTIAVDITSPDEATGIVYWIFYADTAKAPRLTSMGRYDDAYRRTATGWKLARRRITVG
jgi:uncharacterized protein (TIGR02246 family)